MVWLRVVCATCGKATANGRLPREGRIKGDGSERFPRLHRIAGSVCPGSFDFGRWEDPSPTIEERKS